MKLVTMIAASILSTSLTLGVASDSGQKPTPKPTQKSIDLPQIQMLPEGRMPDMTQMPDSQLQATFLLNQNGQSIVVDTAGKPLAPPHHRETPKPLMSVNHVTGNARS